MRNTVWALLRFASPGVALLLSGCPNPNNYTTPRTAPPGKISHSIAVESFGYSTTAAGEDVSGIFPTFPTYSLRVGLADRMELGARLANMSSLGADFKWNFVKGESFDAAIDPGFQWFSVSATSGGEDVSLSVVSLHVPVLLGFNFSEDVTLVASPGLAFSYASSEVDTTDERDAATTTDGVMARLGIGFDFRVARKFAIHPQITFLRTFRDNAALLYMAGIGFNFGNLPVYGANTD